MSEDSALKALIDSHPMPKCSVCGQPSNRCCGGVAACSEEHFQRAKNMGQNHAWVKTPTPGKQWLDGETRVIMIKRNLSPDAFPFVAIIRTQSNGYVIVRLLKQLTAAKRGTALLDFEEYLKIHIDSAITVWLEPQGDKNSLRKLRGMEIK